MSGATLTIDLDAIAANYGALARMASGAEAAAVVKANAYGLGVGPVGQRLAKAGATTFFVAQAQEGVELRRHLGPQPTIFVFEGHMANQTDLLLGSALTPLLNSVEQVSRHMQHAPDHPFGVQLDTGMNRLGMEPDDWAAHRAALLARGPRLVMSHLACADDPKHPMNAQQLAAFVDMTDGIQVPRSLAATGGTLLGLDYHFDMVRPGIGLYGGEPFSAAEPVVRLSAPVIQTRIVRAGESVGYGNTFIASSDTKVATISAGYADGLIRAMGPQVHVYADDTPCKVVGRVSMDLITVDISSLPQDPEYLDIFCDAQGVDVVADAAGTIGYEVLTSLGGRYRREYIGA